MTVQQFKSKYQKVEVKEVPNTVDTENCAVTVKVVTYNHGPYIRQCLDSVLMQKVNFQIQIVIIEDESDDDTRDICLDYAERYPDTIRLFLNARKNNIELNGKPTGLFSSVYINYMIKSPYVAMLEGDDYWTDPLSLQKRYDTLQANEDIAMCFHSIRYYNQRSESFLQQVYPTYDTSKTIPRLSCVHINMPTSTIMFRNGLIEIFREDMTEIVCGDVLLRGKMCQYGDARYISDISPSVYRLHRGGVHSSLPQLEKYQDIIKARKYLLQYYGNKNWDTTPVHESLAYNYVFYFIAALKNRKLRFKILAKSWKHSKMGVTSFRKILAQSVFLPFVRSKLKLGVST